MSRYSEELERRAGASAKTASLRNAAKRWFRSGGKGKAEDLLGWTFVVLAMIAALALDRNSPPRKWHAAVVWTSCTLYTSLLFGKSKWRSWQFWILFTVFLILHVSAMWLVFAKLLPRLIVGTYYVIPPAYIEGILMLGIISRLEGILRTRADSGSGIR